MRLRGSNGKGEMHKKGVKGTHQRCPPQSNSGLVNFFSSFFQPVSFHEKTLNSLTS